MGLLNKVCTGCPWWQRDDCLIRTEHAAGGQTGAWSCHGSLQSSGKPAALKWHVLPEARRAAALQRLRLKPRRSCGASPAWRFGMEMATRVQGGCSVFGRETYDGAGNVGSAWCGSCGPNRQDCRGIGGAGWQPRWCKGVTELCSDAGEPEGNGRPAPPAGSA
jgi:hypothetical protein